MQYRNEINTNQEYKITYKDFIAWLKSNNAEKNFRQSLNTIENEKDIYSIAVDYSIPVIMVKRFKTA